MTEKNVGQIFIEEQDVFTIACDLKLPKDLRQTLRKPFGPIMESVDVAKKLKGADGHIISIGDTVSKAMIENGIYPNLIIWDEKTTRKPCNSDSVELLESYADCILVRNPASTLTKVAWDVVSSSLKKDRESILVDGEEDLLAIPAILNSEVGTNIIYGSPGKGAILIVVDRKIKSEFREILSNFELLEK